ncbi:MAG: regulatory protein RecX [Geodermatophilaceae bacterium]|nr:regulatory protein RecX [Geodermatophilaceae bacterium]
MNVISGIVPTPRRPGRFDLLVDGQSAATLSLEALERLGLSVGQSVTGLEAALADETARLGSYDRALNMLAFRARSASELARLLVRKGEDPAHVTWTVDRLKAHGLLDDAAFARSFTRSKVLGAGQSRRRVGQDLSRKGVARDVSDAAIRAVFEDEQVDQASLVQDVARKKLRSLMKLEPTVRRRRLYAFLARRGYDADDIRKAMTAVCEIMRGGGDETEG